MGNKTQTQTKTHSLRRCLLISISLILFTTILTTTLFLTILRPKQSTTIINSVHLSSLHVSLNTPSLSLSLNLTLTLNITARNPNHASFSYNNGTARLLYRGELVGVAEIPSGEVEAEGEVNTQVDLTIMAGKLVGNGDVYGDFILGTMDFETETEILGIVKVLGVLKHRMVTFSNCEVVVGIRSGSVESDICTYRTKF